MRPFLTKHFLNFLQSTCRSRGSCSLDTHSYTANCTFIRNYIPETLHCYYKRATVSCQPILREARRYKRTITFAVLFLFHTSQQPATQHSLLCILTPIIQFPMGCICVLYVGIFPIRVHFPRENKKRSVSLKYYSFVL